MTRRGMLAALVAVLAAPLGVGRAARPTSPRDVRGWVLRPDDH